MCYEHVIIYSTCMCHYIIEKENCLEYCELQSCPNFCLIVNLLNKECPVHMSLNLTSDEDSVEYLDSPDEDSNSPTEVLDYPNEDSDLIDLSLSPLDPLDSSLDLLDYPNEERGFLIGFSHPAGESSDSE